MQIAQRKTKILKAIIEAYIKNGEPVGSKLLCSELDFTVSSATVRNEMAELSELGLLVQPHTSAGRIPSQQGYRLYVNSLMDKKTLPGETKALICDKLVRAGDDPEKLLKAAAKMLSELVHGAVIAAAPSSEGARIHRLRFVQTGLKTGMAILITSGGLIKTALFKCDYVLTPEIISVFETMFNRSMEGVLIKRITPAFVQTLAVEMGDLVLLVPSVLAAVMTACHDVGGSKIIVRGRTNFLGGDDNSTQKELLRFIHDDDSLEALAEKISRKDGVSIGTDTGFDELCDSSVISCKYNTEASVSGSIALIVPIRTDYAYDMAALEYTAGCVSDMLKTLLMID